MFLNFLCEKGFLSIGIGICVGIFPKQLSGFEGKEDGGEGCCMSMMYY
jgi:hypothetical protein